MPTRSEIRAAYAKMLSRCVRKPNGCLLFQGAKTGEGYASVRVGDTIMNGHRLTWLATRGPIRGRRVVRHDCDTPLCVEETHLLLGTHADNSADMVRRNRSLRGERANAAKLSNAQADEIRIRYFTEAITQYELADQYLVNQAQISRVLARRTFAA